MKRVTRILLAVALTLGAAGHCGGQGLKCQDGATSKQTQQHRQGACSGHGGIA